MAKISALTVYEVVVPARLGATNSPELGSYLSNEWDLMPICLIEAEMSDGIVALGEVGRGLSLSSLDPWLSEMVGLEFSGRAIVNLPERWQPISFHGGALEEAHPPAKFSSPSPLGVALEMIQMDWLGKQLDCRVVDLLGGAYREEVLVDYWCGRKTPEDLRSTVSKARELGFNGIKMKSRHGDPVLAQVKAIKEAGGSDFGITIDPMYQWFSPLEAMSLMRSLEPYQENLRIEDPFPEDRPEFWRRLRQVSSIPLIWHARGATSLRRALQEGVADGYNASGGFTDFQTQTHAIEVAGYSCWRGSALELGVAQAAGLQAAAAARCCVMASDFQSALIRQHTLTTWDWKYREGKLALPTAPGIGVDLDKDAIATYQTGFQRYRGGISWH